MSFGDIVNISLGQLGVVFILLVIFVLGIKKVWVWGYQLQDAEARVLKAETGANWWRDRFLEASVMATKATDLAEKHIDKVLGGVGGG